MNKQSKILLTSFLILIFLIVCGCTKQKVPVYEDNTLSIKLPDEWSWGGGYWGPGTEIFTIRNPKGILPSATVSVASLKVVKDDRPELLIEHAYNSNGVVDHVATQVFRSGALAGIEYNFDFGYGSASYRIKEIWLDNSGQTYILCFRAINYPKYEDTFKQILDSFHFKINSN